VHLQGIAHLRPPLLGSSEHELHDACYSSPTDRLTCDVLLLAGLRAACNVYPEGSSLRTTCYTIASIYFVGVRLFGWTFYTGTGSPL
jgi:hypothetical protein